MVEGQELRVVGDAALLESPSRQTAGEAGELLRRTKLLGLLEKVRVGRIRNVRYIGMVWNVNIYIYIYIYNIYSIPFMLYLSKVTVRGIHEHIYVNSP